MKTTISVQNLLNELYQNHISNIHMYPTGTELLIKHSNVNFDNKWTKVTIDKTISTFINSNTGSHMNIVSFKTTLNGILIDGFIGTEQIISIPYRGNEYLENTSIIPIPKDTPVKVQFYDSDTSYIRVFSHIEVDGDGEYHYYVHDEDSTFKECKSVTYIHNTYDTYSTFNRGAFYNSMFGARNNVSNPWANPNNYTPNAMNEQKEFGNE